MIKRFRNEPKGFLTQTAFGMIINQFNGMRGNLVIRVSFQYLVQYFIYSIFRGRRATENPWNSTTLEWTTPVVPGHGNWPGEIPTVYRWPYDYSKPGSATDFIPQTVPYSATPESNLPYERELAE